MRMMVKFRMPVEDANANLRNGKIEKVFGMIMEELKPEAAYFFLEEGLRAGLFVIDMQQPQQVAEVAERFFFGLNAEIDMTPVMTPEDLQKGLAAVQSIAQRYG